MDIQKALEHLCAQTAPSGFEQPASEAAKELLAPLMDEVWTDRLGNLIGVRRCGKENAPRLLLDAHLDEIGLMVTGAEDGFLRFRSIGGVDPRMLPDREVTILTEPPLFGVVSCLPPHVQKPGDSDKSVAIDDLFIDVGMTQDQVKKNIPVGTPVSYRGSCFQLGEKQMCGKTMDDRSCFVTLLRTAEILQEKQLDVDLYIMGSTREEISGAGATVGTFSIEPNWCIAVDVTHGQTPDGPKEETFHLGGGPTIGIGPNMTTWMTNRMIAKAKQHHIPWQAEVMAGSTGTNGWPMQTVREGVATSVISLPLKYMHTPIEVLNLEDMESVAQLLAAFTEDLGKEAEAIC